MIDLTLKIENHYASGVVTTTAQAQVSEPPPFDDRADWEDDEIFPHTGTGKEDGDSAYFVTSSSRPDLIPVGTEYEFGL
jgi:hypothetical protein